MVLFCRDELLYWKSGGEQFSLGIRDTEGKMACKGRDKFICRGSLGGAQTAAVGKELVMVFVDLQMVPEIYLQALNCSIN